MEDAKCILCGHNAKRKSSLSKCRDDEERVNEFEGECYKCPECKLYCFYGRAWSFVQFQANGEQKKILSEYVKSHQLKDGFLPLKWDDVKRILGLNSKKKT